MKDSLKPSARILDLTRKRLDDKKREGVILFHPLTLQEASIQAVIDYLDELYDQTHQETIGGRQHKGSPEGGQREVDA